MRQGPDGRFHPLWDTRIAGSAGRSRGPTCGRCSAHCAHVPLLLVRGAVSNILLPETVARMRAQRPDMAMVEVPGIGHAPTLAEPEALAPFVQFLEAHD